MRESLGISMYKKINSADLVKLNKDLCTYFWPGYDLYFLHGWFLAYLSAPSDSEEDLLIPMYLVLDESTIKDEIHFSKVIDKLVKLYTDLAESIYEDNKLIRPLVDFEQPIKSDLSLFTDADKQHLLKWLYGYLNYYLAMDTDITEQIDNTELRENKLYPALFTLCVALFKLAQDFDLDGACEEVKQNFAELQLDLKEMWESEAGEQDIDKIIAEAVEKFDLADINRALNDVFYVVRTNDEQNLASSSVENSLLNKLITKH